MISQANNSVVRAAYPSKVNESKEARGGQTLSKSEGNSKVQELKEAISSGEYKVNIEALSKKMADTLL